MNVHGFSSHIRLPEEISMISWDSVLCKSTVNFGWFFRVARRCADASVWFVTTSWRSHLLGIFGSMRFDGGPAIYQLCILTTCNRPSTRRNPYISSVCLLGSVLASVSFGYHYPLVNWHNCGKSPFSMDKSTIWLYSTISMVIFNSNLTVITRG